jgi:hypothetical protein
MLSPPPLAIKRNIIKPLKRSRFKPQISHDDGFNEIFILNLLPTLRIPCAPKAYNRILLRLAFKVNGSLALLLKPEIKVI